MRPTLIALALIAAAALPAQALTVFSDDFETGVKGGNVTPTGWMVSDGSVDVVYPGWFGGLCLSGGRCVDLDGSTGNAGVLSQSLNLNAGWTYTLSFDIAGNRRNAGSETVLVSFGSASSTLTLANAAANAPRCSTAPLKRASPTAWNTACGATTANTAGYTNRASRVTTPTSASSATSAPAWT